MTYPLGAPLMGATSPAFVRGCLAGMVSDAFPRIRKLLNASRVADVWTFTIDSVANLTDYLIRVAGITLTITSDAAAVDTEIRDALIDAVNESPLSGVCTAVSTGATTFTLTANQAGEDLDVVDIDSRLSLVHTTSASNNSALPAGRMVSRSSDGLGCAPPSIVAAVAAIKTLTITPAASAKQSVGIVFGGVVYGPWDVTSANPAVVKDDVEALAALMNSDLPANTVAITEDDTKLIGTSEVPGTDFYFTYSANATGVAFATATSQANVAASFTYPLVGAVQYPPQKASAEVLPDETAQVVVGAEEMFLGAEDAPSSLTAAIYVRGTAGSLSTQVPGTIRFTDSDSGKCLAVSGLELNRLTAEPGSRAYSFRLDNPTGP